MGKHSPGPWRFDHDWRRLPTMFSADGVKVATLEKDKVVGHRSVVDLPEREANARLIEAAPDLLACLKEYVRDFGDNEDSDSKLMAEKAEAAIAKAEGRS